MRRFAPAGILAVSLTVSTIGSALFASPAESQLRPGIERGDYWGDVRARFRNEALEDVGVVLERWQSAWNDDDAEALLAEYDEDAILVVTDHPLRSVEEFRPALEALIGRVGPIQIGLQDFEVGGELAIATMAYRYDDRAEGGRRRQVGGYFVVALVKHSGSWKIRSQLFRPDSDPRFSEGR